MVKMTHLAGSTLRKQKQCPIGPTYCFQIENTDHRIKPHAKNDPADHSGNIVTCLACEILGLQPSAISGSCGTFPGFAPSSA